MSERFIPNEELLKTWAEDSRAHSLIACHDWQPSASGIEAKCESCGRPISTWPVCRAKANPSPLVHLVCREQCWRLLVRVAKGPVPFGGRIKKNELPAALGGEEKRG